MVDGGPWRLGMGPRVVSLECRLRVVLGAVLVSLGHGGGTAAESRGVVWRMVNASICFDFQAPGGRARAVLAPMGSPEQLSMGRIW